MSPPYHTHRIIADPAAVERVLQSPIGTGEELLLVRKGTAPRAPEDVPELHRFSVARLSGTGRIEFALTLTADEWIRHSASLPVPSPDTLDEIEWYWTGVDPVWGDPSALRVFAQHCRTTLYDDYDVVETESMIFSADELARIGPVIASLLNIDYEGWTAAIRDSIADPMDNFM